MMFRALLALTVLAGVASAQPGVTETSASTESQTDQHRRHLIGKWEMAAEYIGEDQIRHFTSITSTYKPDGNGIRVVVMEIGKIDGSGAQVKTGGKDEAILYRVDSIDATSFKLTQWTTKSAPFYETWTIVSPDLMRMANGLELKRIK